MHGSDGRLQQLVDLPHPLHRPRSETVVRVAAVGAALVLACFTLSGCASSRETAREKAIESVRAKAEALRSEIATAAANKSGDAQLEAVQAVLPDMPLVAAADSEDVTVTGAMTAKAEAGGGLTYESFSVRLCLQHRIAAGSGETEVAETTCAARIDTQAPADETVRLTD